MNGAKGPNPQVVGKIWDRVVEFEEEQRNAQPIEEPTPTQKIWKPVSDLHLAQQQAFKDMLAAMSRGDLDGAADARKRIQAIEDQQKENHAAARAYVLSKMVDA